MGKIFQSFKMSMKSILGNKGRSALTMLGIIIGVASVIILTGIGGGATKVISDSMAEMGTKLITVNMMFQRNSTRSIGIEDMQEFLEDNPDLVSAMSPTLSGNVTAKSGRTNFNTSLSAYDSSYSEIQPNAAKLSSGRFLSDSDVSNRRYNCIVGSYIKEEMFGGLDPVGETIKLNGRQFNIIGCYEETSNSTENSSDNKVTIPYTTAMRFLKQARMNTFYFAATTEDEVENAVTALESFITKKLGTNTGFMVNSVAEMIDTLDEMMGTMTTMLAGIAAISLIVGGIGIMNIMTVTVSERTREIGIRKAIGARTTDILLQFLIESIVLSGLGGIVGIIFGIIIAAVVGNIISMQTVVQTDMVILSFTFSIVIGVFFGIAPARRAAKLNPIEALRSE
ncbi:MAG: ABC transporter permease [Eubacteriales bacterium]|nr:ABC transporter permease [Eubacteriales bacterium]